MEKDAIKFEKPLFMKGEKLVQLLIKETKKGKIRWKKDTSHPHIHLTVFVACWKKGITLNVREEYGYLSLCVCSPKDHVETFNATTDPSLNGLFTLLQNRYREKKKVCRGNMVSG